MTNDWLTTRIFDALRGDLMALLELISILNIGWLAMKGLLMALQALKLLYQEVVGGNNANGARARRVRMNTLGEEVRKSLMQFGVLETAKVTVLKGANEVQRMLTTSQKQIGAT
ncbi:hypothetical protein ACG02S_00165 [Roseateles sp. DC23W]|uniref:Uncharacterized protein n=1 Tax=Pelomonas dachongensis TaxID=3299029 RepID=A0ABW7EFR4_9BURK